MKSTRKPQLKLGSSVAIIYGILGRQGNQQVLYRLEALLKSYHIKYCVILAEEITNQLMEQYNADSYIQLCCPRISTDWGHNFPKPLLNCFEAFTLLNKLEWDSTKYELYYYAYGGKEWSNYYPK
jgi:2-(3-amino-3-carboxypropyl)histidine synthase